MAPKSASKNLLQNINEITILILRQKLSYHQQGMCTPLIHGGRVMRNLTILAMSFWLALFGGSFLSAADTIDIQHVTTMMWSGLSDVVVQGNYAYCVARYGLLILDVSNPAEPAFVSQIYTNGAHYSSHDIAVSNSYVYLVTSADGVAVIDVTNPAHPAIVSHVGPSNSHAVVVTDGRAYISDRSLAITVYDVSNPSVPVQLGGFSDVGGPGDIADIDASGNYVYLAHYSYGLTIYDISNLSQPMRISAQPYNTWCNGVRVMGNYAYVAEQKRIMIYNIADPAHATLAGIWAASNYSGSWMTRFTVAGNYAYADVVESEGHVFKVVNISNPSNPFMVSTLVHAGIPSVSGNYAYICDPDNGLNGLLVVDIANLNNQTIVGQYVPQTNIRAVATSGNYVYAVSADQGLFVIDITNRDQPVQVGHYASPGREYCYVAVAGAFAYLERNGVLEILNVSDPANPTLAGSITHSDTYDADSWPNIKGETRIAGNYAYIAAAYRGLRIIDISNPAEPILAGSYQPTPYESARYEAISGKYCYVAVNRGVDILDVSDPANILVVGTYPDVWPFSIEVVGNKMYLLEDKNGGGRMIDIVDISNAAAPRRVGQSQGGDWLGKMRVNGDYLYTPYYNTFTLFDAFNPTSPAEVGQFQTFGTVIDMAISGDYIYIADYYGLVVAKISLPTMVAGDIDNSGSVNVGDIVSLINYVYKSGALPNPMRSGDTNCDGKINVGDIVRMVNYIFKDGLALGC